MNQTVLKWRKRDLDDEIPQRYEAVLALTRDDPAKVLPQLVREYIESVENDSEVIDECQAHLRRVRRRNAEKIIGRFHYLRTRARRG